MDEPVVSIMVITYNQEQFISDAIESFLEQKCKFSLEIVIGDDCSTDNTQNIIRDFGSKYPNLIKPILNPVNLGPLPNAINVLEHCTGKYIALCEGDDFWVDPLKLQKQVDFLEQNNDYVLSFHNVIAVNVIDDKRTRAEIKQELFKRTPEEIPAEHPTHTSSMLFRNVIRNFPGDFNKIISGDSYLQFVLARYGKSTFQKNIYPNVRRRHPQSVWSYKDQEYKIAQGIYLYEKLLEIAINQNEVKYLNKILIKHRIRYVKFLWTNGRKREYVDTLKKTIKEAWVHRLLCYLSAYIIITLPLVSTAYRSLKNNSRTRLK
jgi:glycosyltransferase involved in cell wall biosynthesis